MGYIVLDTAFNRANYASLIGKYFDVAPSYANVKKVDRPPKDSPWGRASTEGEKSGKAEWLPKTPIYLSREEQLKRLPSHLGDGWNVDSVHLYKDEDELEYHVRQVMESGFHVAVFKEGPESYRMWISEVISSDPLDKDGWAVARWFDYRPR